MVTEHVNCFRGNARASVHVLHSAASTIVASNPTIKAPCLQYAIIIATEAQILAARNIWRR